MIPVCFDKIITLKLHPFTSLMVHICCCANKKNKQELTRETKPTWSHSGNDYIWLILIKVAYLSLLRCISLPLTNANRLSTFSEKQDLLYNSKNDCICLLGLVYSGFVIYTQIGFVLRVTLGLFQSCKSGAWWAPENICLVFWIIHIIYTVILR